MPAKKLWDKTAFKSTLKPKNIEAYFKKKYKGKQCRYGYQRQVKQ